ncbi:hypothetical protein V1264_007660 [Littorina saxatilis]|uniref:Uncharacterized protein n=1 Tax=Littorina saxatilis TaxID=31220 RepID=A0AAN9AW20_9CAEN
MFNLCFLFQIGKIHPLQEGDKIIFGHKNGYKVKVGETAEQPDSEFQFIFERRQPSKSAVTPLQEHRQQEEISGDTILSSGDCTEPPVYTPRRNGPHTPDKGVQQAKDSSRKRDKSLLCENAASEDHSRSPSRVPQTESQKSKPFKADHNSDSGKKGRNVPVKESLEQKNETSKESPKENGGSDEVLSRIEEGGVAKENKARSKSPWIKKSVDEEKKLPSRRRDDEGDGKTEFSRRLSGDSPKTELPRKPGECEQNGSLKRQSEDSVPASAQQNTKQDSSGFVSIRGETKRSVSPKREQSAVSSSIHGSLDNVKSKSPKQIDRKKSPRASDQKSSPRYRDRSKSPRQSGRSRLPNSEGSEHRSRSPLHGESAQSRLVSPKDKVSEIGSRPSAGESRLVQGRSRSPKPSFARKRPVSPELDNSSSSDADSSERRSVSPEKKERRSSSVYDEPPVLSPEYVVKTPSPCGFIDRTYDEEYEDINDIDKESLLYSVPPTPGHSLHDLSPSPHHSRRDCSPETKMGGVSGWERTRDNDRFPFGTFQSRNKDLDIEFSRNQTEKLGKRSESRSQKNYNRPKDSSVERDFFFKSRRKSAGGFSDQKRKKSVSRTEHERAEPDSTTVHRDRNGIDADSVDSFKRHKERSEKKCAENKRRWLDAEKDTKNHKERSDEKCSENKRGWLDAEKDTKKHKERSDEKCSENKRGWLDAEKDTKRHKERSDEKCSENKSGGLDAENDTKKAPTRRSNDRDGRHHDYRNKTKEKSKDSPLPTTAVGRNVFEEFTSSDRHDSGLHSSGKKRRNSSGDDSSKSKFKSSKPHPKPYKSFGEKENGPTPGKESSSNHTGCADRNRDKLQSDGKLLKDVRVSVQRVGVHRTGPSKHRGTDADRKQIQSKSAAEDGVGTYRDQNKQPSHPSKEEKTASGGDKVRRSLSTDTSLFAQELERLSTVQRKEKNKSPRDKTLPAKDEQLTSSQTKNQKSKDKVKRKLPSEQSTSERGREKSRHTSGDRHASSERRSERKKQRAASVSSRSVTPDPSFSTGESEKLKPGRKVATRRPRQVKDDTDQDEGKPGRDPDESKPGRSSGKKPRQRRKMTSKTKGGKGDDDECLEDGVVWYEEDTCESEACFRPADRRVQWVCCDDCDKWYHTVCVGIINLEDLKDEDYHCGCTDD